MLHPQYFPGHFISVVIAVGILWVAVLADVIFKISLKQYLNDKHSITCPAKFTQNVYPSKGILYLLLQVQGIYTFLHNYVAR